MSAIASVRVTSLVERIIGPSTASAPRRSSAKKAAGAGCAATRCMHAASVHSWSSSLRAASARAGSPVAPPRCSRAVGPRVAARSCAGPTRARDAPPRGASTAGREQRHDALRRRTWLGPARRASARRREKDEAERDARACARAASSSSRSRHARARRSQRSGSPSASRGDRLSSADGRADARARARRRAAAAVALCADPTLAVRETRGSAAAARPRRRHLHEVALLRAAARPRAPVAQPVGSSSPSAESTERRRVASARSPRSARARAAGARAYLLPRHEQHLRRSARLSLVSPARCLPRAPPPRRARERACPRAHLAARAAARLAPEQLAERPHAACSTARAQRGHARSSSTQPAAASAASSSSGSMSGTTLDRAVPRPAPPRRESAVLARQPRRASAGRLRVRDGETSAAIAVAEPRGELVVDRDGAQAAERVARVGLEHANRQRRRRRRCRARCWRRRQAERAKAFERLVAVERGRRRARRRGGAAARRGAGALRAKSDDAAEPGATGAATRRRAARLRPPGRCRGLPQRAVERDAARRARGRARARTRRTTRSPRATPRSRPALPSTRRTEVGRRARAARRGRQPPPPPAARLAALARARAVAPPRALLHDAGERLDRAAHLVARGAWAEREAASAPRSNSDDPPKLAAAGAERPDSFVSIARARAALAGASLRETLVEPPRSRADGATRRARPRTCRPAAQHGRSCGAHVAKCSWPTRRRRPALEHPHARAGTGAAAPTHFYGLVVRCEAAR